MTQSLHSLLLASRDLIGRLLRHLRRVGPVILASEHINRTGLGIDIFHTRSPIPATEVEVEIPVKNAVGLRGVHMPDQLAVLEGRGGRHHAVDPLGIVQRLVDEWGAVCPRPVHVEIVGALERNGAAAADFFVADGAGQADLTGHGGTADDGFVEVELLDEGGDAADVGIWDGLLDNLVCGT